MSKVFYIFAAACMLVFVSGCVSSYNGTLTSTVHRRSDYVNGSDVRYYNEMYPNRPVAPDVHNNTYRPRPNNQPTPAYGTAQPGSAPGNHYNQNNANARVCYRDSDCPGNQRCQNVNRSTNQGTCR